MAPNAGPRERSSSRSARMMARAESGSSPKRYPALMPSATTKPSNVFSGLSDSR